MSKTNALNSEYRLIENDSEYEIVSLRRSERRSKEPLDINSEFTVEDDDIKVQKVERKQADLVRDGERRQSGTGRRTARPKLLSIDEIAILRKK